jgi:hypothetical protein
MSSWSRKDYELVANILRRYQDPSDQHTTYLLDAIAEDFCWEFSRDNERFKAKRFKEACNVV